MFNVHSIDVMTDQSPAYEPTGVEAYVSPLGDGGYCVKLIIGDVYPTFSINLFAHSIEQLEKIGQATGELTEAIVTAIAERVTAG